MDKDMLKTMEVGLKAGRGLKKAVKNRAAEIREALRWIKRFKQSHKD